MITQVHSIQIDLGSVFFQVIRHQASWMNRHEKKMKEGRGGAKEDGKKEAGKVKTGKRSENLG